MKNILLAIRLMRLDNNAPLNDEIDLTGISPWLKMVDDVLGSLSESELETVCCGEESEADAILWRVAGMDRGKVKKVLTLLFEKFV